MRSLALSLIGAVAVAEDFGQHEMDFMKWVGSWNKSYGTREEYVFRFQRWLETHEAIQQINDPSSGHTHTAAHNKFSDFTKDEYQRMLGYVHTQIEYDDGHAVMEPVEDIPNGAVDWTTGSCVTPVKDQGQCGSCWTFGSTEPMETNWCLAGNALYSLAEQQLVDCCGAKWANFGCNGGMYQRAWNYLKTRGMEQESDYPYTAMNGTCTYDATKGVVGTDATTPYNDIGHDTASMMAATDNGAMAVAIDASSVVFQTYKSGVITSGCGNTMNHAVVVVGYDSGASSPYWKVRNSWGAAWGDAGFVLIGQASGDGVCLINTNPSVPNVVAF